MLRAYLDPEVSVSKKDSDPGVLGALRRGIGSLTGREVPEDPEPSRDPYGPSHSSSAGMTESYGSNPAGGTRVSNIWGTAYSSAKVAAQIMMSEGFGPGPEPTPRVVGAPDHEIYKGSDLSERVICSSFEVDRFVPWLRTLSKRIRDISKGGQISEENLKTVAKTMEDASWLISKLRRGARLADRGPVPTMTEGVIDNYRHASRLARDFLDEVKDGNVEKKDQRKLGLEFVELLVGKLDEATAMVEALAIDDDFEDEDEG